MELSFLDNLGIDYGINPFKIVSAKYKSISKELSIEILFNNVLSIYDYDNFVIKFKERLKPLNIKACLNINYENSKASEDVLKEYLKVILERLLEEQPRYKALDLKESKYDGENTFNFLIPEDAHGMGPLALGLEEEFKKYGLDISILLEQDPNKKISEELRKLDLEQKEALRKMNEEAIYFEQKQKAFKEKEQYVRPSYDLKAIKDIPNTYNDLSMYANQIGQPIFHIEGEIFACEVRQLTKSTLATLKITDGTDSIVVKKWLRGPKEIEAFKNLVNEDYVKVIGKAEYDPFLKNVVIMASSVELIDHKKEDNTVDDAVIKRVELHAHTKMSALDGLVEPADYFKLASKLGHKAIAFTDHNCVYSIPDIDHAHAKFPDIKPIFGVELNFIDDENYFIAFNNKDIDLKEATFVIFDLETTGLSSRRDNIIEIAATKYHHKFEVDTFETFVNPKCHIPERITEITSIDDEMVKDAPTIEEVMPKFKEFIKDSILVAHNAKFDVGMIQAIFKRLGMEYEDYPVIDTLNALRALHFNDLKRFNLKEFASFYKVKQEHHHRAIDDTRVTALCFVKMLDEIFEKGVTNYKDINSLIDETYFYKTQIPTHVSILVKNQIGYKNMYKLLSDALTNHCYGEARLLRSVLNKYREGILVGSGCVNGLVFEEALNGNDETLEKYLSYYDYIEVQPPTAYKHLFKDIVNGEEVVKETIKLIVSKAKSLGKIVVATGDVHYLKKEDKKYRDILIASPLIGGGFHNLSRYEEAPDVHFRTTTEMLNDFSFLGEEQALEIVVNNTNLISDSIEEIRCFPKEMYAPHDDEFIESLHVNSIVAEVKSIVNANLVKMYGDNPHPLVKARLERELNSIISNGYSSVYYMSHLLVKKSLSDGYLVGSRGSVGSSLVATLMNITEINPLAPHYRCPHCHFQTFKMTLDEKNKYGVSKEEESFVPILEQVDSGFDLPDATCPICGATLKKDGHDIPFETFLGFNGDKVPDIDLNFSGDYQAKAHLYVRELMGSERSFRAGTIQVIQDKNGYGYVKGYCERKNINLRSCEMDRIASKLVGVRRSSGQHPGGIVVVPKYQEIYDVTPVQYPADNANNEWRTTHFDYHSFENNLLKLDILGHDDPTMIRYLMNYVNEHQEDFPFDNPQDIPIDDKNVYRLFSSTDVIGLKPDDIDSEVASYAVPEFGTPFVRKLLTETKPTTFAELVKVSGLSHGTGVWLGNSEDLVLGNSEFGKLPFKKVIGCRDDIMVQLLHDNLEPIKAFQIMEFVRKGNVKKSPEKWEEYKKYMMEMHIPDWYIWSCSKIEYMFPKAHATAYVSMALRIAWFKVYAPKLFYSAYFSSRAKAFHPRAFVGGKVAIRALIKEINDRTDKTVKDNDLLNSLYVALEMTSRGIKFLPIDIMKSEATTFVMEDDGLRLPFASLDGLGESVAFDIVNKRKERTFTSKKDVLKRTRLNQTLFNEFNDLRAFGNLPEEDREETLGLFA